MFFDPLYLLFVMPALLLMLYAQHKVRSTFETYSQVGNMYGLTGAEAARRLLQASGLAHVSIEGTEGDLSDHYDPTQKVLRLSPRVYGSASVAALGIVAHEVGHAVQDQRGYVPMKVRAGLVPVANLGSSLGPIFFIVGLLINFSGLIWLGLLAFTGAVAFSMVTLPVEWDASNRARRMLQSYGLVSAQDYDAASKVLSAAALTYVAAMLQAVLTLVYFAFRAFGGSRED